jgi:predicted nucleic acid-binding protein
MADEATVRAAFLDANVLVPAALRDTLLRAANVPLFAPYWSERVLQELERALIDHHLTPTEQAGRLITTLRHRFPAALVDDYRYVPSPTLPDPGDIHVLRAAIASGATVLVTLNTRHFPAVIGEQYGISIESPDSFLIRLFTAYPNDLVQIIRKQAAALRAPPMTTAEVLDNVALQAPTFADRVAKLLSPS